MIRQLKHIIYLAQVLASALVIVGGASYGIRCLAQGQIFCAICFGLIAYLSGYRFLLKASLAELSRFRAGQRSATISR